MVLEKQWTHALKKSTKVSSFLSQLSSDPHKLSKVNKWTQELIQFDPQQVLNIKGKDRQYIIQQPQKRSDGKTNVAFK